MKSRFFTYLGCVLSITLHLGCSSGMIMPHGRVLKDGQPFTEGNKRSLQVTFLPFVSEDKVPMDLHQAYVDGKEGTFIVRGRSKEGIPPGKYRIGVKYLNDVNDSDLLRGEFGPGNSQIIRDVMTDEEEIVIDIAKPDGMP